MAAGVGHAGHEEQRVDGGLPDEQQERSVGLEHHPVEVDGASDGDHGGGCRCLAALLVHLKTTTPGMRVVQFPVHVSVRRFTLPLNSLIASSAVTFSDPPNGSCN